MEQRKTAAAQTTTTEKDTEKILNWHESAKDSTGNRHGISRISLIDDELKRCEKQLGEMSSGNTDTDDVFIVKTANEWMEDAKKIPNPHPLWLNIWNEGELCCLFADSYVGKSIYAVQIATAIAQKQNVLYFDFELTEKQFQLRYTNEKESLYMFPNKLYRVEADPEKINLDNFEDEVIGKIEGLAKKYNAKIFIIDNITWLCASAEDGEMACKLMKRLMVLKKKNGFSILVLAHTPKRDMSKPITQNDLAGSKQIQNFFDASFAIGFSIWGDNYRYIKEVKPSRFSKKTYGANNVINAVINKSDDGFTHFNTIGYSTEKEHLQQQVGRRKDSQGADNSKDDKLQTTFAKIFKGKEGIGYNELQRLLAVEYGYRIDKDGRCKSGKSKIEEGIDKGFIHQGEDGKYYNKE